MTSSFVAVADEKIQHIDIELLFVEIQLDLVKLLLVATYIPSSKQTNLYKDLFNFVEEASINYLPENLILCGYLDLPNIS